MRRGDAQHRRAARKGAAANQPRVRGLGPRTFPAKRDPQHRSKRQLWPVFARYAGMHSSRSLRYRQA